MRSLLTLLLFTSITQAGAPLVVYDGFDGPGKGKHIVLISGDEEYRSEEAMPILGKILAKHHGFKCTVLFAIDPKDGTINPDISNIPGLESLKSADLMILFTRFRDLPDEQMKHIDDYLQTGKPIIGMRTATHAFNIKPGKTYSKYSFNNKDWPGGFGKQVLGDTWLSHHGKHKSESTRGIVVKPQHPVVKGIKPGEIWGPTDVYGVRLPLAEDAEVLVLGEVLTGMKVNDPPVKTKQNDPMMPIVWTRAYKGDNGKTTRVLTTTMGCSQDLEQPGLRKVLVNGVYWGLGMEDRITDNLNVEFVGPFQATPYGFKGYVKGRSPSDYALR